MIPRTASQRRRRASKSAASGSPQRGRRPSVAVVTSSPSSTYNNAGGEATSQPARRRRASIAVPEETSPTEFVTVTAADETEPDSEPEIHVYDRSPRGSLVPDTKRSPRGSLTPDFNRSPRNSLVPDFNRSPRNSIIPDTRGSRNNLLPDPGNYSRSPRGSLCPELDQFSRSRNSLIPDDFNRSPRNSLVPDYNRSPRNSLVPDVSPSRSARNSLVPDVSPSRSPRGSIGGGETGGRSSRGSTAPEPSRSPRGSLVPDSNRSPRGSLIPDPNRSPRGSIASENSHNRSPRNSLPLQESPGRSPRGSIGSASLHDGRSPRGSIDIPLPGRGGCNRSPSPYRNQRSANYTTQDSTGSRRASSSVSQLCPLEGVRAIFIGPAYVTSQVALARKDSLAHAVSGDERRRLCEHTKLNSESSGVAAYGSVVYQLNHANMEASGTCDFLIRGFGIVYRTIVVSVVLICLTALPVIMFIIGLQFIRDCPREPRIPVYMIVGGTFGTLKMLWLVWRQVRSRRFERRRDNNNSEQDPLSAPSRVVDFLLTAFLIVWFVLGNVWIMGIYWPKFESTLYEPDIWCHKTLYVFSLVHLAVLYSVIGVMLLTLGVLLACQLCLCNLLVSCK